MDARAKRLIRLLDAAICEGAFRYLDSGAEDRRSGSVCTLCLNTRSEGHAPGCIVPEIEALVVDLFGEIGEA